MYLNMMLYVVEILFFLDNKNIQIFLYCISGN